MTINLYYQNSENNFGDLLSKEIVSFISKDDVVWSPLKKADMVALGSLGERVALKKFKRFFLRLGKPLDVWGTGFLYPGPVVSKKFINVHALRGYQSKTRFACSASVALGDPGFLAPLAYKRTVKSNGSILCLPHLHDHFVSRWVENISYLFPNKKIKIIGLSDSLEKIITAITEAEFVVSTAMHPLIVAQSFSVPFVWIEADSSIHSGARYKFEDTFSVFRLIPQSINLISLLNNQVTVDDFLRAMDSSLLPDHLMSTVQQDLIASFPRNQQ